MKRLLPWYPEKFSGGLLEALELRNEQYVSFRAFMPVLEVRYGSKDNVVSISECKWVCTRDQFLASHC